MAKFTQGKWECDFKEDKYIWSCKDEVLGELYFTTLEETKANTRLIAAAPEMYRYLKTITSNEDIFELTKINIDTLLARIDGEECHDKTNLDC